MSEPVLLVDKSDGVAILALNRPGSLDALSRELRGDLVRSLRELSDSPEARFAERRPAFSDAAARRMRTERSARRA